MSDDLSKVVFGEPIECRGQKPDGFPTGRVPVQWSYNGRPYLDVTADDCRNFGMPHEPVLIRLPIDVPCNSKEPSDAIMLTAGQAAMFRKVLAAIGGCAGTTTGHQTFFVPAQVVQDARDALALLPEPVDADEAAKRSAIGLACGAVADAVFYHNSDRHLRTKLANALVDLTRALERDSREG